jgi:alkanesulfonate monooxygenase SsuD/methylene tetrahydromethanopterin reductase-like flavin-dependent oxidoreductase (luciferase family)
VNPTGAPAGNGTVPTRLEFGVNLNNRAPLLTDGYGVRDLVDLGALAEDSGFDSLWLGDSLLARPRHDPLVLMAALSQRTSRVRLGTACLVVTLRDPLYLAMAWATIDQLSKGRTILGACAGNAAEQGVHREFAVQGLDVRRRVSRFEETLTVLRELWTNGSVTFHGKHLNYDDVAFFSGSEVEPLRPLQSPPPMWIVSNPRIGGLDHEATRSRVATAAERIVRLGDGWMTCCRATHPEEVAEQVTAIRDAAETAGTGEDPRRFDVAYQVTMNVGDSREVARDAFGAFIGAYYPEFGSQVDLSDWGPVGTPDDIVAWIRTFAVAGVNRFICRFGSVDQPGQVLRFARDILPGVAR